MTSCSVCGEREAVTVFQLFPAGQEPRPPMCGECLQRDVAERADVLRGSAFNPAPDFAAARVLEQEGDATSDELAAAAARLEQWEIRSGQQLPPDFRAFVERHRRASRSPA